MAFLLIISTSLWLYNLLELRKEVENEVENVITSLGPERCKKCVEFLPDYSALSASVVSSLKSVHEFVLIAVLISELSSHFSADKIL